MAKKSGFTMIVPHSRPMIDKEDIRAVAEVLSSGQIAQGKKVKEFEAKIANFVGAKYSVAVSSGTAALYLALAGLGAKKGDEIIVPTYVCTAPYMAILHSGAKPKIVDIDLSDNNISAATAKKAITSKTKAIIVPHMFGTPAEVDELLSLDIPVIENCAQSLGAEYKGKKVGSYGTISICSFYATKMITAGEGGMILTNNREIYKRILEIREYDKRPLNKLRFNYKMTDFQAALGLSQLKRLNRFINRRRKIASIYSQRFSKFDIKLPVPPSHKKSVFYRYVITLSRMDKVKEEAKKKHIICERPVWKPLHMSLGLNRYPNSDYIHKHALSVPIYPGLAEAEIDYVTENLELIFRKI